jgi:DNA-binding transcriptional MerR regulator
MQEWRVDELAREASITVRTVRSYVTRGLLPPPSRVEGRTYFYGRGHLARLRLIAELLDRGYTLDTMAELIKAREAGRNLADVIGLEVQVAEPWSETRPRRVTRDQLVEMFGFEDASSEARGVEVGALEPDGDEWIVRQPKLLEVAVALVEAGIPIDVALDLGAVLREAGAHIADRFVELVDQQLLAPFEAAGMPSERMPEIASFLERIRPLADAAVTAYVAIAMDERTPRLLARVAEAVPRTPTDEG